MGIRCITERQPNNLGRRTELLEHRDKVRVFGNNHSGRLSSRIKNNLISRVSVAEIDRVGSNLKRFGKPRC